MAHIYSNLPLEKMLLQFMTEDDPMFAMLKWFCEKLMETEVNAKINVAESERTSFEYYLQYIRFIINMFKDVLIDRI